MSYRLYIGMFSTVFELILADILFISSVIRKENYWLATI